MVMANTKALYSTILYKTEKPPGTEVPKGLGGWALRDSNPRPPACKKAYDEFYLTDIITFNSCGEKVWPARLGPAYHHIGVNGDIASERESKSMYLSGTGVRLSSNRNYLIGQSCTAYQP